jgi:hypothetical protein
VKPFAWQQRFTWQQPSLWQDIHILGMAMGGFAAMGGNIDGLIRHSEPLMVAILKTVKWFKQFQNQKSADVEQKILIVIVY